jgi:hypothetical protein
MLLPRWAGHVARIGEKKTAYRRLVGNPEGKSLLGRPRRRWVDNIKMDLGEIVWGVVEWICLAQDRATGRALVNLEMNLQVFFKCWETIEWLHNWWPLQ